MFAHLYELVRLSVLIGLDIARGAVTLLLNRGRMTTSGGSIMANGSIGGGSSSSSNNNFFSESGFSSSRSSLCDVLRSLIINNIEHFQTDRSLLGVRFSRVFCGFLESLNSVECGANEVGSCAHHYDLDSSTPGNGYRSQVAVVDSCIVQCIRVCRTVCMQRGTMLFRKAHYLREVEAYAHMMGCLRILLQHLKTLKARSSPADLFPEPGLSSMELLLEAENIDTSCFYGRCLGFQFCESMMKPIKFLSIAMASFSDAYYNTGSMVTRTASSLISCGKYTYSPEDRAKRIVEVSQKASVDFCKAFWLLQEMELLKQVPDIVCPAVVVNRVIQIAADPMELPTVNGGSVSIPIPSSHLRPAPVICRLLSASVREGQLSETKSTTAQSKLQPPSPYLIIQCHGGGFVAQSSKSHEVYLRDWAAQLDVPFLCIDYSLAPQAPYPRALEECLFAYAWAIQNAHRLGSTGERICLVGDSAGGNLMMGVTLKAIELGIRKPDGVYILYTPLMIDFVPSPSRLLCIMDPMLPFGFMMRCLKAYAGQPTTDCSDNGADSVKSDSIGPASATCSSNVSHASTPSHERPLSPATAANLLPATPSDHYAMVTTERDRTADVPVAELISLSDEPPPPLHTTITAGDEVNSIPDDPSQPPTDYEASKSNEVMANSSSVPSTTESFVEVTAADLLELATASSITQATAGTSTVASLSSVSLDSDSPRHDDGATPSQDYVRDFMDLYVLDKMDSMDEQNEIDSATVPLRSESAEMDENVLFELPVRTNLTRRVSSFTGSVLSGFSDTLNRRRKSQTSLPASVVANGRSGQSARAPAPAAVKKPKKTDGIFANRRLADGGSVSSVIMEFEKFKVNGSDPYLSPYLASDEVLRQLPKLGFLSLQLDPCLDDSIMFCKRLRKLGNDFQIDILDSLPHGFLNFALVSKDAHDASNLCVQRLKEMLNIPTSPNAQVQK